MNSEYGTKSPSELKELARRQMKKTTEVIPCVTVTEEHWRAMIELQKTQIALLESITEAIPSLATRDKIADYMNQQITILTEYAEETKECTKVYQTDMQNTATETANRLTETSERISEQVGKTSEKFSQSLSSEQDTMKEFTKRLARISLIPTAILVAWELVRLILSLI